MLTSSFSEKTTQSALRVEASQEDSNTDTLGRLVEAGSLHFGRVVGCRPAAESLRIVAPSTFWDVVRTGEGEPTVKAKSL